MDNNEQNLIKILNFTHEIYKVKNILRFKGMPGWENENIERWDSVAEHSYRMAIIGVMLAPYLETKVSLEKVLKMILIHDIVEIVALDYSPVAKHNGGGGHAFNEDAFKEKYNREMSAAETIFKELPEDLHKEFLGLFTEYINTKADKNSRTPEGCFAYALDKLEATIQIIDWKKESKNLELDKFEQMTKYMHTWTDYDSSLKEFANLVEAEAKKLLK